MYRCIDVSMGIPWVLGLAPLEIELRDKRLKFTDPEMQQVARIGGAVLIAEQLTAEYTDL